MKPKHQHNHQASSTGKIDLKLDGQPLELERTPPPVASIIAFLRTLPDDELLTRDAMLARAKVNYNSFKQRATHPLLTPFKGVIRGGHTVWGNEKAIAQLRKLLGQ